MLSSCFPTWGHSPSPADVRHWGCAGRAPPSRTQAHGIPRDPQTAWQVLGSPHPLPPQARVLAAPPGRPLFRWLIGNRAHPRQPLLKFALHTPGPDNHRASAPTALGQRRKPPGHRLVSRNFQAVPRSTLPSGALPAGGTLRSAPAAPYPHPLTPTRPWRAECREACSQKEELGGVPRPPPTGCPQREGTGPSGAARTGQPGPAVSTESPGGLIWQNTFHQNK